MRRSAPAPEHLVLVSASKAGPGGERHARRLTALALVFFAKLKLPPSELSLSLVRDPTIRRLKKQYFGVDQATDVLSFPAGDSPAPGARPLGDIVISLDTARRAARAFHTTLDQELARYLAHGLLHLRGFDHQTPREARAMERLERRLLGHAGMLARSDEL
jgi:probable rRNA maturation factor